MVSGGRDVGEALAGHPAIGKIMFTGSTATGKAIISSSADTVKRLTLELGGNDAGIVLPDADPKAIAEGLFWGAFINTGQTCAALKRLYVHDAIYDAVCEELTAVAAAMPMGDGLDEANVLGPLQNRRSTTSSPSLVEAAKDSGARILLGGNPEAGPARATSTRPPWSPTSTTATRWSPRSSSAPPCRSSATAPWTRPSRWPTPSTSASAPRSGPPTPPKPARSPPGIQAGTVWINKHGAVDPRIPFGGAKQSGYGLEFGARPQALGRPQVISY